jgi:hypothetical protein
LRATNRVADRLMLRHQLPTGVGADRHLAQAAPHMFVQQAQDAGHQVTEQHVVRRFGNGQMKSDVGSDLRTAVVAR